MLSFEAEFRIW